jgi:hypothetical protein
MGAVALAAAFRFSSISGDTPEAKHSLVALSESTPPRMRATRSERSAVRRRFAKRASVHNARRWKCGYPLLSTFNLYLTRGLHEALGRAA